MRVDSQTTMTDFMASDVVKTEVQGMIKSVEIRKAPGTVLSIPVKGRVKLEKVRTAVLPALPKQPGKRLPLPVSPRPEARRACSWTPATFPSFPHSYSASSMRTAKEVYGLNFVDSDRFPDLGLCDYQTNLAYAKDAPRIASSPIVAKAVKTISPANVDIVISNSDAARIRTGSFDFRTACRVTVVKR